MTRFAVLAVALQACGIAQEFNTDAPATEAQTAANDGAAATTTTLVFPRGFGEAQVSGPLVAGMPVLVQYDTKRFYDIVNASSPVGYFASAHHCYGYGCCEVTFPESRVNYRFGPSEAWQGASIASGAITITLPEGARQLELWFDTPSYALHSWYCGCDSACSQKNYQNSGSQIVGRRTYDSHYDQNYVFAVRAPLMRLADGQWTNDGVNVWVDIAAVPLASAKAIGIRWSTDGWNTFTNTPAKREGLGDGGYERWGVDLVPAATSGARVLEYAIYEEVDGATLWAPGDGTNYRIELAQ